jgi:hypothetical protein
MASSQDIAKWVVKYIDDSEWKLLDVVISESISKALPNASIEMVADLTEEHLLYVDSILRDRRAILIEDGGIPSFELDEKEPYIRRINQDNADLASRLRSIDPYYFEDVCRLILEKLGAKAEKTSGTNDGGVDFYALEMTTYSASYPLPKSAALAVVGQAKRYAVDHEVTETEIRKFIGGAVLIVDELRKLGKINVLSPVVYAFWTTSNLHIHAREYSQKMGVWHLDGMALAEYILKLQLIDKIFPKTLDIDV